MRRVMVATGMLILLAPSFASGGATPAQKCEAAKINAVAKAIKAKLVCQKQAILKGLPVDGACIAKAEQARAAFAKAGQGGCAITGDLGLFRRT
jgi:hypothetical protein